jgi:hypothetical protein
VLRIPSEKDELIDRLMSALEDLLDEPFKSWSRDAASAAIEDARRHKMLDGMGSGAR